MALSPAVVTAGNPPAGGSPPPSIAQRCHTDALHCILAFLSLSDAIRALQCCRDWLRAGLRERPRSASLVVGDMSSLNYICASRMAARHVTQLTVVDHCATDPRTVRMLGAALPRLRQFTCALHRVVESWVVTPREAHCVVFPPSLTRLRLCLSRRLEVPSAQRALGAVAGISSLTSLSLFNSGDDGKFYKKLNLSPLTLLSSLTHLSLPRLYPGWTGVVRRLHPLRSLTVENTGCGDPFVALGAHGHSLARLERISGGFSDAEWSALVAFPALRILLPLWMHTAASLPLIALSLHTVQLRTGSFQWFSAESIQASLLNMPQLTALKLQIPSFPPNVLTGDVGPRLRLLSLQHCRLDDMRVFARTPHLEALSLSLIRLGGGDFGQPLSVDDVLEMMALLPLLRHLAIVNCFDVGTRETREQLLTQRLVVLRPSCALQFSECEFGPEPSAE